MLSGFSLSSFPFGIQQIRIHSSRLTLRKHSAIVKYQHILFSVGFSLRGLRRVFFFVSWLVLLAVSNLPAQPFGLPGEGPRYPGTTGQPLPYDTTALREARERTLESAGLLEQPIDPAQYLVGPNDQLTVTIPISNYIQHDLIVTPEAKVVIPRVGEVDLRGRTLAEARTLIGAAVARVFRVSDVSVSLKKMRQFKVSLIGAVLRPGTVVATPTTRVSEVIDLGGGASTVASKRSVLLHRSGKIIEVDLLPYYARGDLGSNPYVEGGDVIQVGVQDKKNVISIYGAVQRPGEFAYRKGDSVSSLINYALGFAADALLDSIQVVSAGQRGDTLERLIFQGRPDGTVIGDRPLMPGDRVFVRRIPDYLNTDQAVVAGEVRYPGVYPIELGRTRLRDLITSAGGFTEIASVPDAMLIRRHVLQERDPKFELIMQIDPEKRSPEDISYLRVKSMERPGVMTVDINALMAGRESENILLTDEDSLYVPSRKDFLKVTGKVKNPGNVTFTSGAGYEHYLDIAGGYGWRADRGETRIIKANGDTFLASSESNYRLEPGDTIFVPEEGESNFWAGFTQVITVLAQIGTIVAVVVTIRASN